MIWALKFAVFAMACYFIYVQLQSKDVVNNFKSVSNYLLSAKGILLVFAVFILQFLNYTLEAVKWSQLIRLQYSIKLLKLIKAVYVGNAISIFTPNRVGSYIGRLLILKDYPKLFVTATSFLGNLSQLTITVFFGVIGFLFFKESPFGISNELLLSIFAVLTLFFMWVLLRGKKVLALFNRFQWYLNFKDGMDFLDTIEVKTIGKVLFFAWSRYMIFVIEFWLILMACGIDISFTQTIVICGVVYAVSNFIPSPMMGNLGTREFVVLLVFGGSNMEVNALSASLLIWIINVAFPSILGAVILNLHQFKNKRL